MATIIYKDAATWTTFVSALPVTESIHGGVGPVAIGCRVLPDGSYDFTAPINPNVVGAAIGADGRVAQAYPWADIDEAGIQAWIDSLSGDGTISAGSVTLIAGTRSGLPSDWKYPATP